MRRYRAQKWSDQTLVVECSGVSLDVARLIARAAVHAGMTGRIMSEDRSEDYCEVYPPHGEPRIGTWAETTIVVVPA